MLSLSFDSHFILSLSPPPSYSISLILRSYASHSPSLSPALCLRACLFAPPSHLSFFVCPHFSPCAGFSSLILPLLSSLILPLPPIPLCLSIHHARTHPQCLLPPTSFLTRVRASPRSSHCSHKCSFTPPRSSTLLPLSVSCSSDFGFSPFTRPPAPFHLLLVLLILLLNPLSPSPSSSRSALPLRTLRLRPQRGLAFFPLCSLSLTLSPSLFLPRSRSLLATFSRCHTLAVTNVTDGSFRRRPSRLTEERVIAVRAAVTVTGRPQHGGPTQRRTTRHRRGRSR